MLKLTLFREDSQGGATISRLFLDGTFMCDILEDQVREIPGVPVLKWKIKGKTAIPMGTYEVVLRQSGHFGPDTLTLLSVPGYEYIRIHAGNTAENTEGCLLPGIRNSLATVGQSRDNLLKIRAILVPAIRSGQKVEIEIIPPKETT